MKRYIRHILTLLLLLPALFTAQGQTDAQFTQYWAVPTYYNPACAGSTEYLRVRGGAKLQWIGIENAPKSFLITGDMPFKLKKQRLGVGVEFGQESLGLFSNLAVNLQLCYTFKFLKGDWSVGLQGGYLNEKFKGSDIVVPDDDDYHQSNDEALPRQDISGNSFDLAAGVLYTHKYFYAGVSCQHILEPEISMKTESDSESGEQEFYTVAPRMLYFVAGSNIPLKNTLFELQPSVLVKSNFTTWNAEITARATYNKFITFGVGYRYKEAISVMAGAHYKGFFLGYAYDYPLSTIAKGTSGSHEIVAGYQLKLNFNNENKNKHRSIRIM